MSGTTFGRAYFCTVEEHSCRFSHHLSKPARASMLEVELPLSHWRRLYDMTADVSLDSLCGSQLEIMGMETLDLRHLDGEAEVEKEIGV